MLSSSDKFILDRILYTELSNLFRFNTIVNNYEITISNSDEIINQIIFRNVWKKVNKFLNETKSSNINDAIQEWSNNLEEKSQNVYDESLPEIQRLSQLPLTDLENKKLVLKKFLYKLLSPTINAKLSQSNFYTNNILLGNSIKFYSLYNFISTFITQNINLKPVDINNLLLAEHTFAGKKFDMEV